MPDLLQYQQGTEKEAGHRESDFSPKATGRLRLSKKPALTLAISHLAQNTPGDLRVLFSNLIPAYLEDRHGVGSACQTGTASARCSVMFQTTGFAGLQSPLRLAGKPSSPSYVLRSGLLSKLGLCHVPCLDSNVCCPSAVSIADLHGMTFLHRHIPLTPSL